ncbi:MAG: hypothetical protein WBV71_10985 [Roseobacter sp.]
MATANFQARIERIQRGQANVPVQNTKNFRTTGMSGVAAATPAKRRRRSPIRDHLVSIALGIVLGALVSAVSIGLSMENTPWGPNSAYHGLAYYASVGGFGLAPMFVLISLVTAASRPGFALFSLAYISGIAVPFIL